MSEENPKCPQCSSEMRVREGSKGKFWGCSGFPNCKGTMEYSGPQEMCPTCGAQMVLKNGKNGRFYSCSKYPECKSTKNYEEKCPRCNSEMRKRNGANGEFWGCVKYPECKGTRNIGPRADGAKPASEGGRPQQSKPAAQPEDTTDYSKSEEPF